MVRYIVSLCTHTHTSASAVKCIFSNISSTNASWIICCVLRSLSSLLFFLCRLRRFLISWKSGGLFGLVSVFVQNISVLRECWALSFLATLTSHLCVALNWNDLQAPVVLQYELSITKKKKKIQLSLSFSTFPDVLVSHYILFPFPLSHSGIFSPQKWQPPRPVWWCWHFGVSNVEVESVLIRTKCQFVDITWRRLLPCSGKKKQFETKSRHKRSYKHIWLNF